VTTFRVVRCLLILSAFGSSAYATLICLPGPSSTIDQAQATNESCIANDTEQFSNFTFTSQAHGTVALNPAAVEFQILQGIVGPYLVFPQSFNVVSPPTGSDVSSAFTLSFSVSALNNMVITGFLGHLNGEAIHNGSSSVSIDYCAGAPINGCPAGQGGVLDVSSITAIKSVTLPSGVNSLNLFVTGKIESPDQGSSAGMTSFEMGFQAGPPSSVGGANVPEPGTAHSLLLGLLLIGIGSAPRVGRWLQ
jgi:hypothetical protein